MHFRENMLLTFSAVINLSHGKYKPSIGFCGRENVNQSYFSNVLKTEDISLRFVEANCRSLINTDDYFTMRFKVIDMIVNGPSRCSFFYYKENLDQEISKSFLDKSVGFMRYIFDTKTGDSFVDVICIYLTSNNVVRVPISESIETKEVRKYILMIIYDVVRRLKSVYRRLTLSESVIDHKLSLIEKLNLYKPISVTDVYKLKVPILISKKLMEENKYKNFKVMKLKLLYNLMNYQLGQDGGFKYFDFYPSRFELYKTLAKQIIDIVNVIEIAQLLEKSLIYKDTSLLSYKPLYTSGIIFNENLRNEDLRLQRCLIINLEDLCPIYYYRFYRITVLRYSEDSLFHFIMCHDQTINKSRRKIHYYFDNDTKKIVIPFSACINTESIKVIITNARGVIICNKIICVYDLINN